MVRMSDKAVFSGSRGVAGSSLEYKVKATASDAAHFEASRYCPPAVTCVYQPSNRENRKQSLAVDTRALLTARVSGRQAIMTHTYELHPIQHPIYVRIHPSTNDPPTKGIIRPNDLSADGISRKKTISV